MKYEIHPANGGKCIAEKMIDLGFFLMLPSSVFKVILPYLYNQGDYRNFSTYFSRTKGLDIVVLWVFLRFCFVFCCFIFGLICILNIRDQFSFVLFGVCFSLLFKPCVVTCVLLKRE